MVLVQKKMSRMRSIILTFLVILIIGVTAYLVYKNFMGKTTVESDLISITTNQPIISNVSISIPKLDKGIINDSRFLSLKEREGYQFGESYLGIPTDPKSPPAPTSLAIESIKVGQILVLRWENPDAKLYDYLRIYRSETSGELGEMIADNLAKIVFYQDSSLENGKTYYYVVKTVSSSGKESDNTDQISGIPSDSTPPSPPQNITVTDLGGGQGLEIKWSNPADQDFDQVKIYRSTAKEARGDLIKDNLTENTSYLDTGLAANTTYYYTLVAVDESGNESVFAVPSLVGNNKPFEPIF